MKRIGWMSREGHNVAAESSTIGASGTPMSASASTVDKVLSAVEALAASSADGTRLAELAQATGVNKSTLHHILIRLRDRGWAEQSSAGVYRLGPKSLTVVKWWNSDDNMIEVLHPTLQSICARAGELVHLGRLSEHRIVYLDKVEPDRPIRVWSQVGLQAPAVRTALGRSLLGATDCAEEIVREWADELKGDHEELFDQARTEMARVRAQGFALDIATNEDGIGCVAVPLTVVGSPKLAISISMPMDRFSVARAEELADVIREQVKTLAGAGNTPIEAWTSR